jgi:hypothetical protein
MPLARTWIRLALFVYRVAAVGAASIRASTAFCAGFCTTLMPLCVFCGKELAREQTLKKHRIFDHREADNWLCAHSNGPAVPSDEPSDEMPLAKHTWCASPDFFHG